MDKIVFDAALGCGILAVFLREIAFAEAGIIIGK
jgi:hypothetical protein